MRPSRRERRAVAAAKQDPLRWAVPEAAPGQAEASTAVHEERLDAVMRELRAGGVRSVIDLGCGSGALLKRLAAEPQFTRIAGVDSSGPALLLAGRMLESGGGTPGDRVSLHCGSIIAGGLGVEGFDAATLVETIEHVDPEHLSRLERAVFGELQPRLVVMTTPNSEYNVVYGLGEGEYRHPDHRFEWSRSRFERWAAGVAARNGYVVACEGIGPTHPLLGSSTQLGVFRSVA